MWKQLGKQWFQDISTSHLDRSENFERIHLLHSKWSQIKHLVKSRSLLQCSGCILLHPNVHVAPNVCCIFFLTSIWRNLQQFFNLSNMNEKASFFSGGAFPSRYLSPWKCQFQIQVSNQFYFPMVWSHSLESIIINIFLSYWQGWFFLELILELRIHSEFSSKSSYVFS